MLKSEGIFLTLDLAKLYKADETNRNVEDFP
jgi:hypothetical protein